MTDMIKPKISFEIPLLEKPGDWLESIEFIRDGDAIEIHLIKSNTLSYASTKISTVDFNNMADVLLANPQ
jgi:hypothetical protein